MSYLHTLHIGNWPRIRHTEIRPAEKRYCAYPEGCQTILSNSNLSDLCRVHQFKTQIKPSTALSVKPTVKASKVRKTRAATAFIRQESEQQAGTEILEQLTVGTVGTKGSDYDKALIIVKFVAWYFCVTYIEVLGHNRSKKFARPRHVAIHLILELTVLNLSEVGKLFNGRHYQSIRDAGVHGGKLLRKDRHLHALAERVRSKFVRPFQVGSKRLQAYSAEVHSLFSAAASHGHIDVQALILKYDRRIAEYRHIVMYLLVEIHGWKYGQVRRPFGLKGNGLVRYAYDRVKRKLKDPSFASKVEGIKMLCMEQLSQTVPVGQKFAAAPAVHPQLHP